MRINIEKGIAKRNVNNKNTTTNKKRKVNIKLLPEPGIEPISHRGLGCYLFATESTEHIN